MGSLPVGLSASRGAAIIGLSKWATPFTVWQQIMESRQPGFNAKRGYEFILFEGNNATAFGSAFEAAVIKLSERAAENAIVDLEGAYSIEGQDYITCHIDGRYDNTKCNHEGKTTNSRSYGFSWGEPGTDRVPQEVQVQVQQQMMCNGSDSTIVSVLVFPATVDEWTELGWKAHHDQLNGVYFLKNHNTDEIRNIDNWAKTLQQMGFFHQYHIEAKPDTQKILKELYEEFWNKYVLTGDAPDAVDYSDIKRMFTAPKGELIVTDDIKDMLSEYSGIGKEIGASGHLKKRQNFIKTQILKYAKDETTIMDDDSQEKIIFLDNSGNRLGTFNGSTFRARK